VSLQCTEALGSVTGTGKLSEVRIVSGTVPDWEGRVGRLTAARRARWQRGAIFPKCVPDWLFPKLPGADGETGQPMAV